ncbi:MAG: polyhydroxyalkanoate synthesis repressor PhaR [Erythrobacter sp.]
MAKKAQADGAPVIIKKYANRRLYNTSSSSYITLDDLANMVRENVDFQVVDAKSGDDITHSILTQIIVEQEANGEQMLPISFLRQLIGMYGNSMQSIMPSYLEASMANFRANQGKISELLGKGLNSGIGSTITEGLANSPIGKIHETNMAMMRAATEALMPNSSISSSSASSSAGSSTSSASSSSSSGASSSSDDEIAVLRDQMAQMQKKLDELGK